MCGRYSLTSPTEAVIRAFDATGGLDPVPRYNAAPAQDLPVVRGAGRELVSLRWGLVPRWASRVSASKPQINARGETVDSKPSFRDAFARRRCLVPADGWYEWRGGRGAKQPYRICRPDGGLFAFAGIWERWEGEGADALETFAIITTGASRDLAHIHHRMPVVVDPAHYGPWLDVDGLPPERARELLEPAPENAFMAYAVSRKVNNAGYDGADCIAPAAADEPPRLL